MFTGHFAAAFAAKKADRHLSLGTSFMAAQWLDLLWPLLLLTGIEKVAINHDPAAVISLNFTYYPLSHSLLAAAAWAVLFATVYYAFTKNRRSAIITGLLVLSHWVLDWMVHIPDLPFTPFTAQKTGLGLWNYKYIEFVFELVLFAVAVYMYLNSTRAINQKGKFIFWSLIIFLVLIQCMNTFGAPPSSVQPVAVMGLSQWLLVLWAWWADKNRSTLPAI